MKTAVEQLMIALYEGGYLSGNGNEMDDILEKYKEVEKQQIIDAYANGSNHRLRNIVKDYYNETYGSKGSDDTSKGSDDTSYTALDFFYKRIIPFSFKLKHSDRDLIDHFYKQAKQLEKSTISSQTEISDEEIEQEAHIQYPVNLQPNGRTLAGGRYDIDINYSERNAYILSAKWMRDKIQNK